MVKKILTYLLLGIGIIICSAIGSIVGVFLVLKVVAQPMINQFSQGLPQQFQQLPRQQPNQQENPQGQPTGNSTGGQFRGPGGCTSINACITYCTSHPTDSQCKKYSNLLPQK